MYGFLRKNVVSVAILCLCCVLVAFSAFSGIADAQYCPGGVCVPSAIHQAPAKVLYWQSPQYTYWPSMVSSDKKIEFQDHTDGAVEKSSAQPVEIKNDVAYESGTQGYSSCDRSSFETAGYSSCDRNAFMYSSCDRSSMPTESVVTYAYQNSSSGEHSVLRKGHPVIRFIGRIICRRCRR